LIIFHWRNSNGSMICLLLPDLLENSSSKAGENLIYFL